MRRLISMLAAGLLAAGAILTTVGAASADATTRQGCTPSGQDPLWVTSSGVNYYVATPNRTFSGATVRLRLNGTEWFGCLFPDGSQLVTTGTLALTSRATSPGGDVTVETPGNNGNGFASQHWNLVFSSAGLKVTLQNVKTGLYLRVPNSGPSIGKLLTTGHSATVWTQANDGCVRGLR